MSWDYCPILNLSNKYIQAFPETIATSNSASQDQIKPFPFLLGSVAKFQCLAWLGGPGRAGRRRRGQDLAGKILE